MKSELFLQRCFDLARLGTGKVSPNPVVGSVVATPNNILGEGYHKRYGQAHAEVMAINSVSKINRNKLPESTIFVSLEPCNFYGKTPPCSDLIIKNKIPKVVVSAIDFTDQVNFSGIQKMQNNGLSVDYNISPSKGKFVARIRNTFTTKKRPYIILKFAQSKDGFMGKPNDQIWLSNSYSKRLTHKWRSEVCAIIVGTNTILTDDPELNTRHYTGKSPLRIGIDKNNQVDSGAKIKNEAAATWIYTKSATASSDHTEYKIIEDDSKLLKQICTDLYEAKHSSLLVEGGASLLNSFIAAGLWDEARIINTPKVLGNGLKSPLLKGIPAGNYPIQDDRIELIMSPDNVIYS